MLKKVKDFYFISGQLMKVRKAPIIRLQNSPMIKLQRNSKKGVLSNLPVSKDTQDGMRQIFLSTLRYLAPIPALLLLTTSYGLVLHHFDKKKYKPTGSLIKIDKRTFHVYTEGQVNDYPTVVFEHGIDSFSLVFNRIAKEISKKTKVFMYDRIGYGWSDSIEKPTTIAENAQNLKRLLDISDIHGPLILVGHSLGSFNIRKFAEQYPDRVKGLILLDPLEETVLLNLNQAASGAFNKFLSYLKFRHGMANLGITRILKLFNANMSLFDVSKIPNFSKEEVELYKHYFYSYKNSYTAYLESANMDNVAKEMLMCKNSLKNHFVTVISADKFWLEESLPPGGTQDEIEQVDKARLEMHQILLNSSTNPKHIIAKNTSHSGLTLTAGDIIIQETLNMLEMTKLEK